MVQGHTADIRRGRQARRGGLCRLGSDGRRSGERAVRPAGAKVGARGERDETTPGVGGGTQGPGARAGTDGAAPVGGGKGVRRRG